VIDDFNLCSGHGSMCLGRFIIPSVGVVLMRADASIRAVISKIPRNRSAGVEMDVRGGSCVFEHLLDLMLGVEDQTAAGGV